MSLLIQGLVEAAQATKVAADEDDGKKVDDFKENQAQVEAGEDPKKPNDGDTKDEEAAKAEKETDKSEEKKEASLSISARMNKTASDDLQQIRIQNFTALKDGVLKVAAARAGDLDQQEREIVACSLNSVLTKLACDVDFADIEATDEDIDGVVKTASEIADQFISNFTKPRNG